MTFDKPMRSAGALIDGANDSGRLVSYVFSDSSVGRDNHVIKSGAWDTRNFESNPVFLWAHDQSSPPIGRVVDISEAGGKLRGTVEYADADLSPFADSIFRMVKGRYLNATSVAWLPVTFKFSDDRSRPGGVDFSRVELLEVSQVPVPALPTALATARAAGIDTGPIFDWAERMLDSGGLVMVPRGELELLRKDARMPSPSSGASRHPSSGASRHFLPLAGEGKRAAAEDWKVGAARDLPIADSDGWDGPEAEKRIFSAYGFDGDKPDSAKARRAFLFYDASDPDQKGSYKEPFADVVDGELKAMPGGIRAAASRLPQTDGPSAEEKANARAVLDAYEAKQAKSDGDRAFASSLRAMAKDLRKRGLYELSSLCELVAYAEYVCACVEQEALQEQDDSPLPARLRAWVDEGNSIIAAMAAEETDENIAGTQGGRSQEEMIERAIAAAFAAAGVGTRAGKVLSANNERCLRAAHEHLRAAHEEMRRCARRVKQVVGSDPGDDYQDDGDGENDDDPFDPLDEYDDNDDARALRERKAKALKRKHALA